MPKTIVAIGEALWDVFPRALVTEASSSRASAKTPTVTNWWRFSANEV
jgi:hypothetical protein